MMNVKVYEKRTGELFATSYRNMLRILDAIPEVGNAEAELLPAMFVICDYAALSADKDRYLIAESVLTVIQSLSKIDVDTFNKRSKLYGEIIRGRALRGEWLMGATKACKENPIIKVATLLGDILYNPSCAENYNSAPMMLYGIDVTL